MYCRNCGNKLSLRVCDGEGLVPYCENCGAFVFPQFNVAVSMVVTNRAQDKVLLAKHVDDDDFILFAGYVKKGENVEKALPREIKEELGLDVVKTKYLTSRYHAERNVLMLGFVVIVEENKPIKTGGEIEETKWCAPDEATEIIRKDSVAEQILVAGLRELKKKI